MLNHIEQKFAKLDQYTDRQKTEQACFLLRIMMAVGFLLILLFIFSSSPFISALVTLQFTIICGIILLIRLGRLETSVCISILSMCAISLYGLTANNYQHQYEMYVLTAICLFILTLSTLVTQSRILSYLPMLFGVAGTSYMYFFQSSLPIQRNSPSSRIDDFILANGILLLSGAIILFTTRRNQKLLTALNTSKLKDNSHADDLKRANEQLLNEIDKNDLHQARMNELEKSEHKFREMAAMLPHNIFETDIEGTFTFMNEKGLHQLGYPADELINRIKCTTLIAREDRNRARKNITAILQGSKTAPSIYTILKKDGSSFPGNITSLPLFEDGKPIGIRGILVDITQQQEREKQLQELQNNLQSIINSMPSTLIVADSNMHVTGWNKQAEKRFHLPAQKALGKKLFTLLPQLLTEQENIYQCLQKKEQVIITDNPVENGSSIRYEDKVIYPLPLNSGTGVVLRIDDVTERVKMSNQLEQNKKMDAIVQLTGGIAHDFNNMLAAILGNAQMLRIKLKTQPKLHTNIDLILEAANRSAELTRKLLNFAKISPSYFHPLNLHAIIDTAVKIQSKSINKEITIRKDLQAETDTVTGDKSQILNTLLGIIGNGMEAMNSAGSLSISTRQVEYNEKYCKASGFKLTPGLYIHITINDTGCGIAEANKEKIFTPFFTTKKANKKTGLGLAAAFSCIKQHNGAISFYSEENVGTTFHIDLPLSSESAAQDIEQPTSTLQKGSGTILLIDDEAFVCITAKSLLEDLGYKVHTAASGMEGIELYRKMQNEIDLILLDMLMPKMNGKECFTALRQICPKAQIIIVSGFSNLDDVEYLKSQGAAGFISKPYQLREFSHIIAEKINHS